MPWLIHVVAIGSLSRASQELRFGLRLLLGALGNDQRNVMTWNLAAAIVSRFLHTGQPDEQTGCEACPLTGRRHVQPQRNPRGTSSLNLWP